MKSSCNKTKHFLDDFSCCQTQPPSVPTDEAVSDVAFYNETKAMSYSYSTSDLSAEFLGKAQMLAG